MKVLRTALCLDGEREYKPPNSDEETDSEVSINNNDHNNAQREDFTWD